MIDEKLIEVINGLKNKRLSDTEITEVLLENDYTIQEIKSNLHHYNQTHGYIDKDYIKEYEQITGKHFVENKKEEKTDENKKISKKGNLLKKIIMAIIIITMVILIIYVIITFNVVDIIKNLL